MTDSLVRAFVNGTGVDVPAGSKALDAVRAFDAAAADAVAQGGQVITDSRGLPVGADAPVSAGSIFRLIPNRANASPAAEADELDA